MNFFPEERPPYLGQCKARPFNFHRVSLFLSFFLSFSAPTHFTSSGLGAKPIVLRSFNLGQGSTWMMSGSTLKIKVIGQRSRSRGQKLVFPALYMGLLGSMFNHADRTICPACLHFISISSTQQIINSEFIIIISRPLTFSLVKAS